MPARRADVARLAGTSPAVVSYVLNGGPRGVAPETRARVLNAVELLGYRPNGVARSLRTSRTSTLGLVLPDMANPFFAAVARAVEDAAVDAGYTLLVGNTSEDPARQVTYVRTFLARQVDGLLLVPCSAPFDLLHDLDRAQVPWLLLDRLVPGLDVSSVVVDNRDGASVATHHLIEHGHRRIACIAGPPDLDSSRSRVDGWRSAMQDAGLPLSAPIHASFGRKAGYHAALSLIDTSNVDACFVASDEQALGVLRALAERGLRCPGDVAMASFDGIAAGAYATPALTTVAQPFADIGRAAIAGLLERIDRPARKPTTAVLPVTLLRRGSCGCPDPPGGEAQ